MSNIGSLDRSASGAAPRRPATASGELAKLETQLSDWVHCPSSKTSAGKAKIAEITEKIDTIKVQVKKAEGEGVPPVGRAEALAQSQAAVQGLRFDGLGGWLNAKA